MYKLFLTLRYLTRRKIVIFPILVVWLCVMMLIIVTSIMGGFVDRVRDANRDLFGDIIISAASSSQGFSHYEELANELKTKFPEIAAATPVVDAYALLYVQNGDMSVTVPAYLVGVRPEERSQVSKFRESLFQQYQAPMQAVETLEKHLPATQDELKQRAVENLRNASREFEEASRLQAQASRVTEPEPALGRLLYLLPLGAVGYLLFLWARHRKTGGAYLAAVLVSAAGAGAVAATIFWPVWFPREYKVAEDRANRAWSDREQANRTRDYAMALPAGTYRSREELIKALVPVAPSFKVLAAATQALIPGTPAPPQDGCIVGSQIFFARDTRGNFIHHYPNRYPKVSISIWPPGKNNQIKVRADNTVTKDFTLVDDSHSGVFDVDSTNVYAPFEDVQLMLGFRPNPIDVAQDPTANFAPRCHQLLIKLKPGSLPPGVDLRLMRERIGEYVDSFLNQHHLMVALDVQTWDEKQARYLGAVENEKTMMTFIMLLMSVVVLVVIFLIFYQIVRDKTRDIGIIKAVGGSEEGVAGIFLTYGLMIGVVGGGLGVLSGSLFMTNTNQIHEWIFEMTGIIIWDRSVYLFDRIPDVVHPWDAVTYFGVAVAAGVIGALIPAVLAALEDPVQAVRYE
jgi:ABC-type lipoprotein release transport system permease subunit